MSNSYTVIVQQAPIEVVSLGEGKGKRFIKQLAKFADWVHPHDPNKKMVLDRGWAEQVVKNFKNKVITRVPVPFGHPLTATELAIHNKGELVDLEIRDDGLYGTLDIRDADAAEKVEKDLVWDVSMHFDSNYRDKLSGQQVGPTLLHVGLLTDPYLKGMTQFQPLGNQTNALMLSNKENFQMEIKNDRDFPVKVTYEVDGKQEETELEPGQNLEVPADAADGVKKQIADAEAPAASGDDSEEGEQPSGEDESGDNSADDEDKTPQPNNADAELQQQLADTKAELDTKTAELAEIQADRKYRALLSDGKVVPAQEEAFKALHKLGSATNPTVSLSDGSTKSLNDLLAELVEAGPKRVSFGEQGTDADEDAKTPWEKLSPEERDASERMGVTAEEYNEHNGDVPTNDASSDDGDGEEK